MNIIENMTFGPCNIQLMMYPIEKSIKDIGYQLKLIFLKTPSIYDSTTYINYDLWNNDNDEKIGILRFYYRTPNTQNKSCVYFESIYYNNKRQYFDDIPFSTSVEFYNVPNYYEAIDKIISFIIKIDNKIKELNESDNLNQIKKKQKL